MKVAIHLGENNKFIQNRINSLKKKFQNNKNLEICVLDTKSSKEFYSAEVLLSGSMTEEELLSTRNLKQIFVPYTGLNNFPQSKLKDMEIFIEGTHAKAKYVAEKGLGLLLGVMGKVIPYDSHMRKGPWNRQRNNKWHSLFNKRVGLIGTGHIAKEFISLTKPFNLEFSALNRGKNNLDISNYYDSLEELAKNSDILLVSLPLNSSTYSIVSKSVLKNFNGFIVNVGRGKVIEEKPFYELLKSRDILGAGIDVWYKYPRKDQDNMPSNFPFWELDNVILSPHIATNNYEEEDAYYYDIFNKLEDYISKNLKNSIS